MVRDLRGASKLNLRERESGPMGRLHEAPQQESKQGRVFSYIRRP